MRKNKGPVDPGGTNTKIAADYKDPPVVKRVIENGYSKEFGSFKSAPPGVRSTVSARMRKKK